MSVTPGKGVIMIAPVSVCHQVSTIGQRESPTTIIPFPGFWVYWPNGSQVDKVWEVPLTGWLPAAINALMAGCGVENIDLVLVHDLPEP